MRWDESGLDREQIVLFPERLDEALSDDHVVRLLDEVLSQLDWKPWEAAYKNTDRGRPPIHPRVLAGVLLYGLLVGVRSSRLLEAALCDRMDFRWLAQDRRIDHTTLCKFRRDHPQALSHLFAQVALVAAQAKLSPLARMAFDGTKIKANNQRFRNLTPAQLQQLEAELTARFAELDAQLVPRGWPNAGIHRPALRGAAA